MISRVVWQSEAIRGTGLVETRATLCAASYQYTREEARENHLRKSTCRRLIDTSEECRAAKQMASDFQGYPTIASIHLGYYAARGHPSFASGISVGLSVVLISTRRS